VPFIKTNNGQCLEPAGLCPNGGAIWGGWRAACPAPVRIPVAPQRFAELRPRRRVPRYAGHSVRNQETAMTDKTKTPDTAKKPDPHPGMLGDGTEEQNLNQPGNPDARIKKDEVDAAFSKKK
jgi:hypothetical protein